MNTESRIVIIGVLFLLKFLSGVWLTRSGKPFSGPVSAIHKLVSLVTVGFIAITVNRLRGEAGLSTPELVASVITGFLFLLAIVSGGLVSIEKPAPAAILIVHRVTPFLAVLATVATIYLMAFSTS